jgi:PAS domain S-box-containing protein
VLDKTDELRLLTATPEADDGTIAALARYRQNVLLQASTLFRGRGGIPFAENFDALPNVSSLLLSALEELKVAEEELRAQNNMLLEQRSAVESRLQRYYELFQHSPAPAFITDVHGAIQEANLAALSLFRREAKHLEHKPIQALVAVSSRDEFRRQLARLQTEMGVTDWRICFNRTGDAPVTVSAAVSFVPGIGRTAAGGLYWMLRVAE